MTGSLDSDRAALAEGLRRVLADAPRTFDRAAWQTLASAGWLHMLVAGPDGAATELSRLRRAMEEWGAALPAGPALLTAAFVLPLVASSDPAGIADRVAAGRVVTASRHTTRAEADPDLRAGPSGDAVRLRGRVTQVPWLPDADEVLLTVPGPDNRPAVVAVPTGGAGVTVHAGDTADPGISVGDLELDGAPASPVAADPAAQAQAGALYSLALDAQAVGAAAELVARTARYVTDRRQFGQPVGSFQAVRHRLADMVTATEAARALLWLAADTFARPPHDPPWEDIDASRVCAGDAARAVAANAIQCFGGMGFTWAQGVHFYYRRALVAGSLLGDVEAAGRRLVRYGLEQAAMSA